MRVSASVCEDGFTHRERVLAQDRRHLQAQRAKAASRCVSKRVSGHIAAVAPSARAA